VGSTLSGGSDCRDSGDEGREVETEGMNGRKGMWDVGNTTRNTGE
jgi:hypothetical protein